MDLTHIIGSIIWIGIGVAATSTDLKHSRIPNTLTLFGLCTSVILLGLTSPDLEVVLINTIATIFTSLVLWNQGWWRGGDAKLFIALGIGTPALISHPLFPSYPALNLLAATLLIPGGIMAGLALSQARLIQHKTSLHATMRDLPRYALLLFCASWLIDIVFTQIGIPLTPLVGLAITFVAIELATPRIPYAIIIPLVVERLLIDATYQTLEYVLTLTMLLGIYTLAMYISRIAGTTHTTHVSAQNLRLGMRVASPHAPHALRHGQDTITITPLNLERFIAHADAAEGGMLHILDQFPLAPFFLLAQCIIILAEIIL